MEVKEIKNKEVWEGFFSELKEDKSSSRPEPRLRGEGRKERQTLFDPFAVARECQEKTFLQSWNWGEFQRAEGNKIWRVGIFENNDLISVALITKIQAKRGSFLFLPHAPSVTLAKEGGPAIKYEILKTLLKELKKIAKEEGVGFIRISPIWERVKEDKSSSSPFAATRVNKENIEIFKKLGFREAPIHMHPELTWELDITSSEQGLLKGMRKTTRYLIRRALKNKDIEIIQSQNLKDVEIFDKLYQETVKRHHFFPFSLKYLKNEILAFQPNNQVAIFLGKYKGEVVCAGIFVFWLNLAFYHHGASSLKYSKIPVSYLLQWEAIKEAKRRGCKVFNFWGIAPEEKKSHPWAGLTLFKKGFGGYKKEYLKTQDLPLSKSYWLTYFFEKLRKLKRKV